jgi:hypothetical protein
MTNTVVACADIWITEQIQIVVAIVFPMLEKNIIGWKISK